METTIDWELDANFITARNKSGVLIRCNFHYTDCGQDEPLYKFIERHGGVSKTVEYLHKCYRENS